VVSEKLFTLYGKTVLGEFRAMSEKEFDGVLIKPDRNGGTTYINVPFNAAIIFGSKGRVRVEGIINGAPYRCSLIPKGKGAYILPVDRELLKRIGAGDPVLHVTMRSQDPRRDVVAQVTPDRIPTCGMDAITAIKTRRSIRKFTDKAIDDTLLNTILDAGFCVPSAKNKKPWHFIIIKNKESLKKLANGNPDMAMLPDADRCVAVCGDKMQEGMPGFLFEDCAAAIQNMLIAAHGLGVGAVWCGIHTGMPAYENTIEILGLPQKVIPIALIALGYPAEEKIPIERYDISRIHHGKW
jgi:nitroreductase